MNTDIGVTVTQIGLLTGVGTGAISLLSKFGTNLVEGVTAFKKLNEAASTTTGILAGIGGLAPVIALALAGITTAVIAGYSAWKQYDEVANGAVNAFNDTVNSANTTLQKHNAEMYVTIDEANDLVNQLDELNKVSSLNNTEQQRYSTIVQRLNSLIPNLNLSIDDTTHKLTTQTDVIRDQIKEWKNLEIQQAYATARQTTMDAYVELQADVQLKEGQRVNLVKKQQDLIKQYGEDIALQPDNFLSALIDPWTKKGKGRREYQELEDQIKAIDDGIRNAKQAIEENQKLYDGYVSQQEKYLAELDDKVDADTKASAQQPSSEATKFNYSSWLKEQQHALNTGKIQEADYYASLQAMLDKYTDESIISTDERWKAEEAIYKYQKNLSKEQQTAYEKKVKEQQQAAENAAKAAQQEAQAQTTAYKQAFTDWLDEKEYLLNTDQITEQEYYDALKAKNEEYYGGKSEYLSEYRKYAEIVYKWEKKQNDEIAKAAKQAHEDEFDSWLAKMEHALAMGEISEEDYYERLKEMSDEYFKGDEEYLEKYWKYEEQYYSWKQKQIALAAEAEKKAQEDALERQKEKLKLQQQELQTEQDNLNAVISYAQKYSQKQIDNIDERINKLKDEANAIKDNYQDQIDKLKETNEALDNQIEKQKLLEALAKAQQTKKYVFKDGRFQYVDDVDAITSAQEALDNYNRQQSLNERVALLEKQRDAELASNEAAQAALEQQKQRWQDYKDGWANLTDEYEYNQNELLALEQYGIDFEKATWDERIANLNDFKERYAQNVKDLEKLATRLNSLETSSSPSSTIQTATKVDPDQAILDEMKANSQAWWFASTDKEREAIHKRNVELNEMLSKKGTYDSGSGKWSHYAKGTTSARGGLSLVGEKGAELRVLNKGDGVVPARMTENLMDWGTQKPNDFVNKMLNKGKEILSNVINVGNVSLPNVQNAKEFVSELKNLAYQAAYSRT